MTAEDATRTQQYKANIERESGRDSATDLPSYLKSLDMTLHWSRFTHAD